MDLRCCSHQSALPGYRTAQEGLVSAVEATIQLIKSSIVLSISNNIKLPDVIELALLLVCAILCDLALYSSRRRTTPRWPDFAATLNAFRPQASEWLGSAPCSSKATTHSSWPS